MPGWRKTPGDRQRDQDTYTAEYRRNRTVAMRRDKWQCQIRTPGICAGAARECDHIVPGGGHALANLRAACTPCHRAKTAGEGGGYRSAPPPDPRPQPRTAW